MQLKLEPYQETIRDFLTTQPRAYCAVGVGLGKTASTLSALHELFVDGAIQAVLIVAPLRVARITWPNEIAKWDQFKWMKVEHLLGKPPSGKANIYLINYDRLNQLPNLDFCDVVVFDEVTKAKNPSSKRIKIIRQLLKPRHLRWGLTGTPRPNSLLELFAQIRLLDDGKRFGMSFDGFRRTYFRPTDYMEYDWVPLQGSEEKIYKKIEDMTLAMRSSDYLDIADTVVEDHDVALPAACIDIYRQLEKEFLALVGREEVVARNAAVLVGKLLQVSGGAVYSESGKTQEMHQEKMVTLLNLAKEYDEPLLIACNFIHERERICEYLRPHLPNVVDAGKFKGDIEHEWNSKKIRALVADPRSLGHGLNLQEGGRRVIWYSPTWSRELYDQFNARVARKGQADQPFIHRIICTNTIDEVVIETLHERGEGQAAMLRIMENYRKLREVTR
jgi:SNF2 family DNA or RNA helicase